MSDSTNIAINWDERKNRTWHIDEIITTFPHVDGQKVASVNDMVYDFNVGLYRVSAIEAGTNIATLEIKVRFSDSTLLDPSNASIISALSMYMPNSATRVMVNKDVFPHTVTTDLRYITRGIEATSMRCFYGTNAGDDGEVISGRYDGSGNLISDIIPLSEVMPGEPRRKRPPVFETKKDLNPDDIVLYLFYDAVGRHVGTQPFLVSDSGAFFDYNGGPAYITGIELRGEMIDDVDTKKINNPLNNPFQTSLLEAWLMYSDGSEVKVPIDGTKCRLDGIRTFNTSQAITPKNVVLTYNCDPTEPAVNTGGSTQRFITEIYKLGNIAVDTSFALKVFVVPEWVNPATGYRYRYFLTSLDGDIDAEVTNYVNAKDKLGNAVPGTNHGNVNEVIIGLDVDSVLPGAYPGHYHTQLVNITTNPPGSVSTSPFMLDYQLGGTQIYNTGALARSNNAGNGNINIGKDFSSKAIFLGQTYLNVHPLYDTDSLVTPEDPTHIIVMYDSAEYEIAIDDFNQDHAMPLGWPTFVEDSTVILKWIIRDGSNDYIVGYTPLMVATDL